MAQQFFFDGNKRTARLMMNGALMANGILALSVPAAKPEELNQNMVDSTSAGDATEMFGLLAGRHPDMTGQLANARPDTLI